METTQATPEPSRFTFTSAENLSTIHVSKWMKLRSKAIENIAAAGLQSNLTDLTTTLKSHFPELTINQYSFIVKVYFKKKELGSITYNPYRFS